MAGPSYVGNTSLADAWSPARVREGRSDANLTPKGYGARKGMTRRVLGGLAKQGGVSARAW
jgi:hypothetical protein